MDIERLSLTELFHLNQKICRRIDYLYSLQTQANLDRFQIGDRVRMRTDAGPVDGVVTRVNRKTLTVRSAECVWRISPRLVDKSPGLAQRLPKDVRDILDR